MNLDLTCQTQLFVGLFERETFPWIRRLTKEIETALDIGAAQGELTLYLLKKTSAKHIMAFEPQQQERHRLWKNLALNDMDHAHRLSLDSRFVGLGNHPNVISLDSLNDQITTPCFIKMDVDGGELDILRGAKRLLQRPGMRFLVEVHSVDLEQKCLGLLQQNGYTTRIVPNAWWRIILPELRPGHNRWLVAWRHGE
ncbi:MAG TPA: hypothetical protein HPQ00_04520 [Magnetococcales bacterium]|nr:hypothetical protein [Magnetococcales bacterium]